MGRFFRRHTWLIVLLAFLCLFPQALTSQARLNNRVLITGLAIDKTDKGYLVTAQTVFPSAGSESGGEGAELNFISEEGVSITESIKKLSYNIGKIAGLSHMNFLLISDSVFEDENVSTTLDYFLRDPHLPNSIMLLYCKGSAQEQLQKTKNLELSVGLGLQKIYIYKESSLNSKMVTLQDFISDSLDPSKVSIVPQLNITEAQSGEDTSSSSSESSGDGSTSGATGTTPSGGSDSASGGSSSGDSAGGSSSGGSASSGGSGSGSGSSGSGDSGGGSGGQSSGGNSEASAAVKGRIQFFTPFAYFKNGKFMGEITDQKEIISFLLPTNKTQVFDLVIENVNDDKVYHDATVGLRIYKKHSTVEVDFSGARPKAKFKIGFDKVQLMEVINDGVAYEGAYQNLKVYENETLKEAAKKQLVDNFNQVVSAGKKANVDIFKIADFCYRFKNKEWKAFLKNISNIDNYLDEIDFEFDLEIRNFG